MRAGSRRTGIGRGLLPSLRIIGVMRVRGGGRACGSRFWSTARAGGMCGGMDVVLEFILCRFIVWAVSHWPRWRGVLI